MKTFFIDMNLSYDRERDTGVFRYHVCDSREPWCDCIAEFVNLEDAELFCEVKNASKNKD